jgi:hypothetical protein
MTELTAPPLKRYLLFAGDEHREGGWHDFIGSFDTVAEALPGYQYDWYHVVDAHTGLIVSERPYSEMQYNDE